MTCYLTDDISPEEVVRGFEEDVWRAAKLYMANQHGLGGTTGSQHGVRNLRGMDQVFAAMEEHGIPLLGHFEAVEDEVDEFDREIVSIDRDLVPLLKDFPKLKVVVEHVSDSRAADFVATSEFDVYATVTAHHLLISRNAMFREGMNPAHYCKPVPKRDEHRRKIRNYVTSGHRRFGAGTDSAPHDVSNKSRCHGCAAGIFTSPNAVELYATVFDEDDALCHLSSFLSRNLLHLYKMEESSEMMVLERYPTVVATEVGAVSGVNRVPVFWGGKALSWKLR
jgi:dihydroorotase